jgi:hypothetical protein
VPHGQAKNLLAPLAARAQRVQTAAQQREDRRRDVHVVWPPEGGCSSATQVMRASVGWGAKGRLAAFPPMVQGLGVNPQHASARCYRKSRHAQDSFRRKTQAYTKRTADAGNILELPDFQEMSGKSGNKDDGPLLVPKEERGRESAGLQTALGVEIAGKAPVPAAPPGPGQHQLHTPGSRPDQASQQMTHFGNRQRKQRPSLRSRIMSRRELWSTCRRGNGDLLGADPRKVRMRQHHQRDMARPAGEAAHLVVVQAEIFARFKVFLNMEAGRRSP